MNDKIVNIVRPVGVISVLPATAMIIYVIVITTMEHFNSWRMPKVSLTFSVLD